MIEEWYNLMQDALGTRTKERVTAMELVYQSLVNNQSIDEIEKVAFESEIYNIENTYSKEILIGTLGKKDKLVKIIDIFMNKRAFQTQNKVIQACLLIGTYEIMSTDTANIVIINEWVDIAKMFSPDDSHKLVNAVLDSIKSRKENGKGQAKA